MKNGVHPLHRRAGDARFSQVCMDEINLSASGMFLDVAEMPAGQIVDDADFRATCEQVVRQRRADEGGASRHQHKFSAPKSLRRCHAFTAPSIIFTNFCSSLTLS